MLIPQSEYIRRSRRPDGHSGRVLPISREEFWRLWHEHEPFLLKMCLSWMRGDLAEAREALSGAMMRALEGTTIDQLADIGNFRAWLVRIVKNHCIDIQRQQNRRLVRVEEFDYLSVLAESGSLSEAEVSPETGFVRQENYQQLLHAIESLPERLREVMMLRAYQNMPYKEIALHLCITADTARKRAEQARALLQQRLSQHPGEARGLRTAHDSGIRLRSERRAAEEILEGPPPAELPPSRHTHLREILTDGKRAVESPVFMAPRPVRLGQRLNAVRKYIDRHPGGWTREKELADLLFLEGRIAEAADHYRAVLQRQPQQFEAVEALAECLALAGRRSEAAEGLRSALPSLNNQEMKAGYLARIALLQGDLETAAQRWEALSGAVPMRPSYRLRLAEILMAQGNWVRAGKLLEPLLLGKTADREALHLSLCCANTLQDRKWYQKLTERGRVQFSTDPTAMALAVLWRLGTDTRQGQQHQDLSREVKKLKGPLSGTATGVWLQAAWLHYLGRESRCRKLVIDFAGSRPDLREAWSLAVHWLQRLGDHHGAAEFSERQKLLFHSDQSHPPSFFEAIWQNH